MLRASVATLLDCFPRIFLACHCSHVWDHAAKRRLSSRQASVLDHLDGVSPTHLDQLSAHMDVTPSSMSLMIDRLERAGYVRRSHDADDARRVSLRLTRAGARIKSQQKVLDPDLAALLLGRLTPSQRHSALAGLQTLADAAAKLIESRKGRGQKEGIGA